MTLGASNVYLADLYLAVSTVKIETIIYHQAERINRCAYRSDARVLVFFAIDRHNLGIHRWAWLWLSRNACSSCLSRSLLSNAFDQLFFAILPA